MPYVAEPCILYWALDDEKLWTFTTTHGGTIMTNLDPASIKATRPSAGSARYNQNMFCLTAKTASLEDKRAQL